MTKKEKIENTARELFWKHGFKKVSVEEICRKSQVSRKTFYTYYANKSALVIAIMEQKSNVIFEMYEQINSRDITFAEKLKELLELKFAYNKDYSMEFISDFFHPDSQDILNYFSDLTTKSIQLTREFYKQAQAKGEMNPDLNIDFVMWMLQKQLELISSDEALALFPDTDIMTRQLSHLIIFGIMPVDGIIHNSKTDNPE